MDREELIKALEAVHEHIRGDTLDEWVRTRKGDEAADINNHGFEAQAEFLQDDPVMVGDPDDLVHEGKAEEASEINASGVEAQIEYLFGEDLPSNKQVATLAGLIGTTGEEILLALCPHTRFTFDRVEWGADVGRSDIIHVNCVKCGRSGSFPLDSADILW